MESGYMVDTRLPVGVAGQLKWDKVGATPTRWGVKRRVGKAERDPQHSRKR